MISKTFKATTLREGSMCAIPVTFDPKRVFGKVRAPVKVTLNGYTYRSTIASMGGPPFIPLRKSHREAAYLEDWPLSLRANGADSGSQSLRLAGSPPKSFAGQIAPSHVCSAPC